MAYYFPPIYAPLLYINFVLLYNMFVSLIEVKNISFSYDNSNEVLKDISFNVEKGKYITLIGHNGSGKTTIAKLLAGLLPLKKGSIIIDGIELNESNINLIRNKLGIIFQNPDNQFIGSTVRDDIAFGLENHQVKSEDMDSIINEYIKKVGLESMLDKEPGSLSGGQKQRVAIAAVLAMKLNIIIFDEATSMLDPKGKEDIKKLMKELHNDSNITIISITHDVEEVLQSDECIVLNEGKIYKQGIPSDIFKNAEELRKIKLDIPFSLKTKYLFSKNHIRLDSNSLEDMAEELWRLNLKK